MAGLLRDTSPFVADVLDGAHDEVLDQLMAAVEHRKKQVNAKAGLRPKARVRVLDDPRCKDFAGREGIVNRVNKKSLTVSLVCPDCGSATALASDFEEAFHEDRCKTCVGFPDEIRISPQLVTAI